MRLRDVAWAFFGAGRELAGTMAERARRERARVDYLQWRAFEAMMGAALESMRWPEGGGGEGAGASRPARPRGDFN